MGMGKDKEIKVFTDPDNMTNGHGLLDSSPKINPERIREMKGKHRSKALVFKRCNHLGKTKGYWEVVCVCPGGCTWGQGAAASQEEGAGVAMMQ